MSGFKKCQVLDSFYTTLIKVPSGHCWPVPVSCKWPHVEIQQRISETIPRELWVKHVTSCLRLSASGWLKSLCRKLTKVTSDPFALVKSCPSKYTHSVIKPSNPATRGFQYISLKWRNDRISANMSLKQLSMFLYYCVLIATLFYTTTFC